jgi:hypothetical protein
VGIQWGSAPHCCTTSYALCSFTATAANFVACLVWLRPPSPLPQATAGSWYTPCQHRYCTCSGAALCYEALLPQALMLQRSSSTCYSAAYDFAHCPCYAVAGGDIRSLQRATPECHCAAATAGCAPTITCHFQFLTLNPAYHNLPLCCTHAAAGRIRGQ